MGVLRKLLRIFYAAVYTCMGIAGFVAFIFLRNYVSSCLAGITAITNAFLCHLHILAIRRTLRIWYDNGQLKDITRFAFVVLCIGAMGVGYFGASEIMLKRGILPVATSVVIPIIWSLITMKSAGTLLYYSWFYREENYADDEEVTLVNSLVEDCEEDPHDVTIHAEPVIAASAEPITAAPVAPVIAASAKPLIATSAEPMIAASVEPVIATSAEPVIAASVEPVIATSAKAVIAASVEPVIATSEPNREPEVTTVEPA